VAGKSFLFFFKVGFFFLLSFLFEQNFFKLTFSSLFPRKTTKTHQPNN